MSATWYLVGAGPGDPGLITARGLELIRRADVVVYDYLANAQLLEQAPAGAELVYAGKKGYSAHVSQDEINTLLVRKARELDARRAADAHPVQSQAADTDPAQHAADADPTRDPVLVRLKGGDPYVFGRGGEEALALREAGIPFEVVPGVTAGIAAPAYAGIPVTHRKVASSVTLVTGHEDPTRTETSLAWEALAVLVKRGDTVCFYMGVRALPQIAERLQAEGVSSETPVAVVRQATTPGQQTLVSTLARVAEDVARARLTSPAIIVVGRTVELRPELSWYERLPLFGRTVVVTRSRDQAGCLAAGLAALGADVRVVPTIAFAPPGSYAELDAGIERLVGYDWIVFTSANGVRCFFDRLHDAHGKDTRALAGVHVAAIGPATARALEAHGISADVVPAVYRAEGVFAAIRDYADADGEDAGGSRGLVGARVFIPRAQVARDVLPQLLCEAGAHVDVAAAYRTVVPEGAADDLRDLLQGGHVDAVTFTSSSTVRNFCALLGGPARPSGEASALMEGVAACSIGPITSQTLRDCGIEPAAEAERYTVDGLVAAIRGYFDA